MRWRGSADVSLVFWPLLWNIRIVPGRHSCPFAHEYLRVVEHVRERHKILRSLVVFTGR